MFQPTPFGKYLLVDKIGRGGMAEIFLAKQPGAEGFEKEVVIKKILPEWSENKDFLTMLIDEAKLAVLLNHANIVQIYELGKEGNDHYIAMEYVQGTDLRRLWETVAGKGEKIPLGLSLYIMVQALEGLSYAHNKKDSHGVPLRIIHRDVSPQNILISSDGAVKLTDFGIAKATLRSVETVTGVHKGKFSYMSPEQANLQELGQESDLFSAGIVLFEILTGRRLFAGSSDIETLDRIRRADVRFVAEEARSIPPGLLEILRRVLSRNPKDRFQDAAGFREALVRFALSQGGLLKREDLGEFLEGVQLKGVGATISSWSSTRPVSPGLPRQRRGGRRSLPYLIGAGAIVVMAVLFYLFRSIPTVTTVKPKSEPAVATKPLPSPSPPASKAIAEGGGSLSVMVLPWGYVSIDEGERKMSPVKKLSISQGSHRISVFYEPKKMTLSKAISLSEGDHLRCVADFEQDRPAFQCR